MEAADFYTGLVAELCEPLRGSVPEAAEYLGLIRRFGEPALELGCGGGDPLVELRAAGLDVEGVDSSADILREALTADAAPSQLPPDALKLAFSLCRLLIKKGVISVDELL